MLVAILAQTIGWSAGPQASTIAGSLHVLLETALAGAAGRRHDQGDEGQDEWQELGATCQN